jgi:hypothetical protein
MIKMDKRLDLSALPAANVTCRYCAKYQGGRRVAAERGEILGEQLLSTADMTQKLRISRATLNRIRPQLIANGVKMVVVAGYPKYLESSVDKLILRCASDGRPMATMPPV